jgi:hypothetical protein
MKQAAEQPRRVECPAELTYNRYETAKRWYGPKLPAVSSGYRRLRVQCRELS